MPRHPGLGVSLGLLGLAVSATAGSGQAGGSSTPDARALPVPADVRPAPAPPTVPEGQPEDVVLDMPYIAQTEALCGGAAVTMALRYWGDTETRPERFAPLVTPDGAGIRQDDLRDATADLGWTALGLEGDGDLLDAQLDRGRPLVALLEVGPDRYHYVTVVGRVAGRIVFHDPAVSPYRSMSREAFLEAWSGGGRWGLLVLPDSAGPVPGRTAGPNASTPDPARARPSDIPSSVPARSPNRGGDAAPFGPATAASCAAAVGRGVRLARDGRLDDAEGALRAAIRSCPDDSRAFRELAALRLRQDRPADAIQLARGAVRRDPADPHGRELLAASHYLAGEDVAALGEWNRVGPVVVDEVTLGAPTRTRNHPILTLAGLEPGSVLSADALAVGRRRLAQLPAAASTRLSYRPLRDGRVIAIAAVAERPVVPSPGRLAAETALGLFTERGFRLNSASPLGRGELWSLDWRWREPRRHVGVSLALPVRTPVPAVVTIAGSATRETYGFGEELREDRRRVEVGLSAWTSPWLRVSLSAAFDRWLGGGAFGSLGAATRVAGPDGRVSLSVEGALWASPDAPGFARAGAELLWRSSGERRGLVASARLGGRTVTSGAPRSAWPGAGADGGRDVPARGHELMADGRITGPLFGRRIAYGGLEAVRWTALGPLDVGAAAFVDVAAAGSRPAGVRGEAFHTDVGLGLRIGLPGGTAFRVDLGRGLVDGETALSAGLALDGS